MAALASSCSLVSFTTSSTVARAGSSGHVSVSQQLECSRLGAGACHVSGSTSFLSSSADFLHMASPDASVPGRLFMAVPKKKTSRTKTKIRKAIWLAQGTVAAEKAYSLAKAVLSKRATSFIFKEEEEEEEEKEKTTEGEES